MMFLGGVNHQGQTPTIGMGKRNESLEREFLRGAERLAGMDNGWSADVQARLAEAEREKGYCSYMALSLKQVVAEGAEEGLDIGGWMTVAFLLSYRDLAEADDDKALLARQFIQRIASYGPLIAEEVRKLQDLLSE